MREGDYERIIYMTCLIKIKCQIYTPPKHRNESSVCLMSSAEPLEIFSLNISLVKQKFLRNFLISPILNLDACGFVYAPIHIFTVALVIY